MHDSTRAILLDAVARAVVDERRDCIDALHRAARTLGLRMPVSGLTHDAVYGAVANYRRIFHPEQLTQLEDNRRIARDAMKTLMRFSPRLFGGLAHEGDRIDRVQLLLWAAATEEVLLELEDLGIPWKSGEAKLDCGGRRSRVVPLASFIAGATTVTLFILPETSRGERPVDPIDGRALETLTASALERLLENPD